jgi:3-oxoacyl-[acyl-carrier protein] reductase
MDWFSENLRNIVVISSISGVGAFLDPPIEYSVAKAALNHYIKIKSLELARSGICLNAIAPGNILYPGSSWDKRLQLNSDSVEQYINANVPLKKFGTPEDIAKVVYMTGQILVCDGGQSL